MVISVASVKRGTGETTLTPALSWLLSEGSKKILDEVGRQCCDEFQGGWVGVQEDEGSGWTRADMVCL